MRALGGLLLLGVVGSQPAANAIEPVTIVTATGTCSDAAINFRRLKCDRVLYMFFPTTSRVNFTFRVGDGILTFSGGKTMQPYPEKFILDVDSLINGEAKMTAAGICEANVSADGRFMSRVSCDVRYKSGQATFVFVSDGKPVKRTNL